MADIVKRRSGVRNSATVKKEDKAHPAIQLYDGEEANKVEDRIVKIAVGVGSVFGQKSVDFINGKRKINLKYRTMEWKKKHLLAALIKSHGVASDACRAMGISVTCYYGYMKNDPLFEEAVVLINETAIDFAESKLFENINSGYEASIIYFLKTKGRARGYSEIPDDRMRGAQYQKLNKLTDEQLDAAIRKEIEATTAAEGKEEEAV